VGTSGQSSVSLSVRALAFRVHQRIVNCNTYVRLSVCLAVWNLLIYESARCPSISLYPYIRLSHALLQSIHQRVKCHFHYILRVDIMNKFCSEFYKTELSSSILWSSVNELIWINHESIWIKNESLWINHESIWIKNESIWINNKSIWINHESIWINHESIINQSYYYCCSPVPISFNTASMEQDITNRQEEDKDTRP